MSPEHEAGVNGVGPRARESEMDHNVRKCGDSSSQLP